ncbi:glycoside hydrolase family 3 N-terminal domain-containing protein [Specibacter cremeus]|uniref:glycoside hydrolase family 3 N-terminal domain-containing protein n=1 Tax=Specibacter cremeus TaxID=1629051 RepID=UPI001F0B7891|nr:glycoside hydrolase family 3 N-terminal domain-containing protein [Specibacter cremeus]
MRPFLKQTAICAALLAAVPFLGSAPALGLTPAAAKQAAQTTTLTPAQQLASMTLQQRIGQLFMAKSAATGADANTMSDLINFHVGNVYLGGRSYAGINPTLAVVKKMTDTVSQATTSGVALAVATDQEGGYVQVLNGPGFSKIPTALAQGAIAPAMLRADAKNWGNQLRWAGVHVDLAPVLDTVPSAAFAPNNPPIGYYEREYGYTPQVVSTEGNAFAAGLKDGFVAPAIKHFPGLGRVTLNTDTSSNVHDTVTTRYDSYMLPYKTAINDGARWVMVSSAYYDKIDNRSGKLGAFSSVLMQTILRGDDHFTGIILSDDLCNAQQLAPWSLGVRAANFINAGGTMVLCAAPPSISPMYWYLLHLAQTSPSFLSMVNAAALKVLQVKAGQ